MLKLVLCSLYSRMLTFLNVMRLMIFFSIKNDNQNIKKSIKIEITILKRTISSKSKSYERKSNYLCTCDIIL